ncbi:MAG: hypothetical protein Q8N99_00425 [Nanoarchaeota archaeon]|nr:hypothetical protein [Nanoarchaeota archaeon]
MATKLINFAGHDSNLNYFQIIVPENALPIFSRITAYYYYIEIRT